MPRKRKTTGADVMAVAGDPVLDVLRVEMLRSLHRFAAGRAMFCLCGTVLDVRRSVMVTTDDDGTGVVCERCWDGGGDKVLANLRATGARGVIVVTPDDVYTPGVPSVHPDQGVLL